MSLPYILWLMLLLFQTFAQVNVTTSGDGYNGIQSYTFCKSSETNGFGCPDDVTDDYGDPNVYSCSTSLTLEGDAKYSLCPIGYYEGDATYITLKSVNLYSKTISDTILSQRTIGRHEIQIEGDGSKNAIDFEVKTMSSSVTAEVYLKNSDEEYIYLKTLDASLSRKHRVKMKTQYDTIVLLIVSTNSGSNLTVDVTAKQILSAAQIVFTILSSMGGGIVLIVGVGTGISINIIRKRRRRQYEQIVAKNNAIKSARIQPGNYQQNPAIINSAPHTFQPPLYQPSPMKEQPMMLIEQQPMMIIEAIPIGPNYPSPYQMPPPPSYMHAGPQAQPGRQNVYMM